MSEKEIIDEVVSKLKAEFDSAYKVELYPDNPDNYTLQHPNGAILVKGITTTSDTPNIRQQIDMVGVGVKLLFKSLNAPDNIYNVSDTIRYIISSIWIGGMFHFYQLSRTEPLFDFDNEWWERDLAFITPQIYKMGDD